MVKRIAGTCWSTDVQERRKFLGVTQEELAEFVGISRVYLNMIEGGKVEVNGELRGCIDAELKARAQLRHCEQSNCADCEPLLDSGSAPHLDIGDVKEKRLIYGVSRSELADASALWEDVLVKLESGEAVEAREMLIAQIDVALYLYRPRCPREGLLDYISFRFPHAEKGDGDESDEHRCVKDVLGDIIVPELWMDETGQMRYG